MCNDLSPVLGTGSPNRIAKMDPDIIISASELLRRLRLNSWLTAEGQPHPWANLVSKHNFHGDLAETLA